MRCGADGISALALSVATLLLLGCRSPTTPQVPPRSPSKSIESPRTTIPPGDLFRGGDRATAKISIAHAPLQRYSSLTDLISSLPPDFRMREKHIPSDPDFGRIAEEQRNVRVHAYLWGAKYMKDDDYRLILGSSAGPGAHYLAAEISALPAEGRDLARLRKPRAAFRKHLAGRLPDRRRYERFDPPIPISVTGSVLYDSEKSGDARGPSWGMPNSAWEIHPVTAIVFTE